MAKYLVITMKHDEIGEGIDVKDMEVKEFTPNNLSRFMEQHWDRDVTPPIVIKVADIQKVLAKSSRKA